MASSIEWTDETWNPAVGCARKSPGCENCYAEKLAARLVRMEAGRGRESVYLPVVDAERGRWNRTGAQLPDRLDWPLRKRKPLKIFVCSMSDLFFEGHPFEYIAAVFGVMAAAPRHTFQVLTKRPERAREFFAWLESEAAAVGDTGGEVTPLMICVGYAQEYVNGLDCDRWEWPLPNVWLGVSVEDQQRADERIPVLLECPAALRFLSCEPLLGPVDIAEYLDDEYAPRDHGGAMAEEHGPSIGWAIVGGESGPCARECDVDDVLSVVDQCKAAGVPVFVKQLGAKPTIGTRRVTSIHNRKGADPSEWPADLRVQEMPRDRCISMSGDCEPGECRDCDKRWADEAAGDKVRP